MKNEIKFLAIYGNKDITLIMQACDMFDPSKTYGELHDIKIILSDKKITKKTIEKTILLLKETLEKTKNNVIFICYLGEDFKVKPYINRSIRMISNGERFFMFDDFLRYMGFEVITSKHRFINEVKI